MKNEYKVPKVAHRFFKWYCRPARYEELHGDLEELFYERVQEKGAVKARILYVIDVIRCCQPYAWRKQKQYNKMSLMMYKNYFTISSRVLMKNPMSSLINIFGLSIAIGICVSIYGLHRWMFSKDEFHINKHEVYLATYFADLDGSLQEIGSTPRPLGDMLRQDFSEIKKVCRVEDKNVVVKKDDKVFPERIRFVDKEFLEMLTFPLKWGTPQSLGDINSVILSEEISTKYFGNENPIGKDIQIIFSEGNNKQFKVTGVAEPFPESRSFDFNVLINFDNLQTAIPDYNDSDWSTFVSATLIQVEDPSYLKTIEGRMEKYKKIQNESQDDWTISSFGFEPLATLYTKADHIKNSISGKGYQSNLKGIMFMSILAMFMLTLACCNYINIAIVSAAKRLKEIGVRKSVGATSRKVIFQFLAENMFLTSLALIFGVALGAYVVIPWFEKINFFSMEFSLLDKNLWIFLAGVLVFTGLASGMYPAYYISQFQTATIFKGNVEIGKQNPVTKIFLGVQLVIACVLIASGVMFTQNNDYIRDRSWGYNYENVLFATVPDQPAWDKLYAAMDQNPNVISIGGSSQHLGKTHKTTIVHLPERKYEVQELAVDAQYFETMQMELREGRRFNGHQGSDQNAVIVNETLVENLLWDQAIGKQLEIDGIKYEVVGVVKDFHSYNFFNTVKPTLLRKADRNDLRYLAVKVQNGKASETYKVLQAEWARLLPEIPFQGGHQEDVWGVYFEMIDMHGRFWRTVALVAILLAGLGLYGLVTLNVMGRVKEFSIRKVLGAGLKNISSLILKQYLVLFVTALAIGVPVSYFLVNTLFDMAYKYHVPMNYTGIIVALILLPVVLLVVVCTQIRRIAKSNPVVGLKVE